MMKTCHFYHTWASRAKLGKNSANMLVLKVTVQNFCGSIAAHAGWSTRAFMNPAKFVHSLYNASPSTSFSTRNPSHVVESSPYLSAIHRAGHRMSKQQKHKARSMMHCR